MTTPILTSSTTLQGTGLESNGPRQAFLPHRFHSSMPLAQFRRRPETRTAQEITWEPVILPLLERLAKLRSTPECKKWPGADWPEEAAFQDAQKFAERLPETMKARPHISLADDGEINFAWTREGMLIDLGFYGTGTYSYYARDKEGEELFGDDISASSPIPKELAALLTG